MIGFVGLCLLVAAADGTIIAGSPIGWYLSLRRPPGTPPLWLLAPVWVALYGTVGVAGWLAWRRSFTTRPLRLWGWQLAAAAAWTPALFALHSPPLALAVTLLLLVLIALTVRAFAPLRPIAAWLMVPHLLWTGYTVWISAGFWWLNPI